MKKFKDFLTEKAVSKSQQRLMGMALAYKKGKLRNAPLEAIKIAKSMSLKDLEDFASTKHDKLKEEASKENKPLNKPFRLPSGSKKKFGVYVKNDKGNVVKVTFGDPNMEIKRDDPERRKSFRARHGCDNPGPKWKAKYWSCKQWRAGAKVED